ncbi:MAG: hypothetical protein IKC88_01695, partial [Opitutales bacterium]|nr:hypothetical protein [Opitutales bacterium]
MSLPFFLMGLFETWTPSEASLNSILEKDSIITYDVYGIFYCENANVEKIKNVKNVRNCFIIKSLFKSKLKD